jgi:hypothetical protein
MNIPECAGIPLVEGDPCMSHELENAAHVNGQKTAFATASLLLGLATFVNLLSLEKAALAIAFGCLALRSAPGPRLDGRRNWAVVGTVLGSVAVVAVPLFLAIFHCGSRSF